MALLDITYGGTFSMTNENFIISESRGNIGIITDIVIGSGSSANTLIEQIPLSSREFSITFVN